MRPLGRVVVIVLCVVAFFVAMYGGVRVLGWAEGLDASWQWPRQPDQPMRLTTIDQYTKRVAGTKWFAGYFTTMVFPKPETGAADATPILTRWETPTVTISLVNGGGPGMRPYLRLLVRRLDRLQGRVDFRVVERRARITIRFLSHSSYVADNPKRSVGVTYPRYHPDARGMVGARIFIDAGRAVTPEERGATLIHELTHAIGCNGHFTSDRYLSRSVLYRASTVTSWSQNDAAVIRFLYSPWVYSGMSRQSVAAELDAYARATK